MRKLLVILLATLWVWSPLAAAQDMVQGDPGTMSAIASGEMQRLLRAAATGDAAAKRRLDAMFDRPLPYPGDFRNGAVAREFYQYGAELGNPRAMYLLGNICAGSPPAKDDGCTGKWHLLAAEKGNPDAMASLSSSYRSGLRQDAQKALEWERKAAEAGHVRSMEYLARRYRDGDGVEKNQQMMDYWYERAEQKGARTPAVQKRENAARVAELKQGVERGDVDAMTMLARAYFAGGFYGWGLDQDYAEALRLYRLAAARGDTVALNNVGMMYGRGLGVERDFAEAMRWYRRAAMLGSIRAMFNIGGMLDRGEGGAVDRVAALAWRQLGTDHMATDGSNWGFEIRDAMSFVSTICETRRQLSPAELGKAGEMQRKLAGEIKNSLSPAQRLSQSAEFRGACK